MSLRTEAPEGLEPDAFWERVADLRKTGMPEPVAIGVARREATGHHPEDAVRKRAAHEPKLRDHPETQKMREAVIERARRK